MFKSTENRIGTNKQDSKTKKRGSGFTRKIAESAQISHEGRGERGKRNEREGNKAQAKEMKCGKERKGKESRRESKWDNICQYIGKKEGSTQEETKVPTLLPGCE